MDRSSLRNDAERKVWDAFPRGERVDLGPGNPTAEGFDPQSWGEERQVRADVVLYLLLGGQPAEPGYVAKVMLAGAWITGRFYLNAGETPFDLLIVRCWLDAPPELTDATSSAVIFRSTLLPGFQAAGLQARGPVSFHRSVLTSGVNLSHAQLSGVLTFVGATLTNLTGRALYADSLTVGQDMLCQGGFSATGEIRICGAKIGGQLSFDGATLRNPGGMALNADSLTVGTSMLCHGGFSAIGEVRLMGSHIGHQLSFAESTLSNPGGRALTADSITVDQSMFCHGGFTADGEINLRGAHISGQLSFVGAKITNVGGRALFADSLTVDQSMLCYDGFAASGEVRLLGAQIGRQLSFAGATLTNPGGKALAADRLIIGQSMFCRGGFTADGRISLLGARIGGQLTFDGATLTNPGRLALDLKGATAQHVKLGRTSAGSIDLSQLHVDVLALPELETQPAMRLSGLTYTDLDPDPDPPVRQRIAWLRRDPDGFHPQPYEQLAAYYRSIGHDRDARRVLLAKNRMRRRTTSRAEQAPRPLRSLLTAAWRVPGWLTDALAGYGYVPLRAFCWLLTAVAAGALFLRGHALPSPTGNETVNATLFALDSIVPTSPFGLREQAQLTGAAYGVTMALQVLGYALALAVLPAISRALSRADK